MRYTIGGGISPEVFTNLVNHLGEIADGEKKHNIIIKKHKKNKTGAQRNYWHKCLQLISDYTGEEIEVEKNRIKEACFGVKKYKNYDGKIRHYTVSSEKLNVEKYGKLIDETVKRAAFLEIKLPPTRYYGF